MQIFKKLKKYFLATNSRGLLLPAVFLVFGLSCKSNKEAVSKTDASKSQLEESVVDPKSKDETNDFSRGIVSLELKKNGCAAIIKGNTPEGEEIILIPNQSLGKFEEEGKKVKFHFRLLRMPQPQGCTQGIPAEISDLSADD